MLGGCSGVGVCGSVTVGTGVFVVTGRGVISLIIDDNTGAGGLTEIVGAGTAGVLGGVDTQADNKLLITTRYATAFTN
jgi:hypothetical protein